MYWRNEQEAVSAVTAWTPVPGYARLDNVRTSEAYYCALCRTAHAAGEAYTDDGGPEGNVMCAAACDALLVAGGRLPWAAPPVALKYHGAAPTMTAQDADMAEYALGRQVYYAHKWAGRDPFVRTRLGWLSWAAHAVADRLRVLRSMKPRIIDL